MSSFGRDVLYKILSQGISFVTSLVTMGLVARSLGPSAYGIYNFIADFFSNYSGEIKNPNSFVLNATNQFVVLHRMFTTEDKSFSFLKKVWPPILGKNREKFIKNMKLWRKSSIEEALFILRETELKIRNNSKLSAKRIISFAFLNICLLNN